MHEGGITAMQEAPNGRGTILPRSHYPWGNSFVLGNYHTQQYGRGYQQVLQKMIIQSICDNHNSLVDSCGGIKVQVISTEVIELQK